MLPTFDFSADYILENEAVILRPLIQDDYNLLLPFAINEPDLWRFSLVPITGAESLKTYIGLTCKARIEKKEYAFIVFDKKQQKYAGCTRFYDVQLHNQTSQLGFTWYGKDFWGTGLNKHCKFLLLDFAFDKMGLERVEFRADYANKRSIAAMKSLGCTEEGVLRNHLPLPDGRRRNSIILSILKEEWNSNLKSKLLQKLL